jgi:DNA-binding MarR family transcriptional regulator
MPLYTGEDVRIAHAATACDRDRRAAYMAEQARKPQKQREEEAEEFFRQDAIRHEHRVRGRAAYYSGRPAPKRRRDFADPPPPNRQYATIETTVFRDPRMSMTEAATLTVIVAWAGTTGRMDFTYGQLGEELNRSRSTKKRVVKNLKDREYLGVEILRYPNGKARCLRLRPTDKAWPFWHSHRQDPSTPPCGSISAPPITNPLKGEAMEEKPLPAEPDEENPLAGMDPDVVGLYRELVAKEVDDADVLAEKTGIPKEQAVDHIVKLIVTGHLRIEEDARTGKFSLKPTRKPADVVPANNPAFKKRRTRDVH